MPLLVWIYAAGVQNEGWFDPWALLFAFKKKAASLGVQYIEGTVTGMEVTDERVESVQVSWFTTVLKSHKCFHCMAVLRHTHPHTVTTETHCEPTECFIHPLPPNECMHMHILYSTCMHRGLLYICLVYIHSLSAGGPEGRTGRGPSL